MNDIFLSYARADKDYAGTIALALEKEGIDVWWDHNIATGQNFASVTEKAIDDAKCVVVLWSRHSITSEWVHVESSEGKRRNILVPILIEDVKIPLAFRMRQTANLINWNNKRTDPLFERLLVDIRLIIHGGETKQIKEAKIQEEERKLNEKADEEKQQKEETEAKRIKLKEQRERTKAKEETERHEEERKLKKQSDTEAKTLTKDKNSNNWEADLQMKRENGDGQINITLTLNKNIVYIRLANYPEIFTRYIKVIINDQRNQRFKHPLVNMVFMHEIDDQKYSFDLYVLYSQKEKTEALKLQLSIDNKVVLKYNNKELLY